MTGADPVEHTVLPDFELLHLVGKGKKPRRGAELCKPLPQIIESVNDIRQLGFESHAYCTIGILYAYLAQPVLVMRATI